MYLTALAADAYHCAATAHRLPHVVILSILGQDYPSWLTAGGSSAAHAPQR